jgi:GAF domain-containing protein
MAIDRRDIVDILRGEIESLKTRNRKLESLLLRRQQAFRALNLMDEIMLGIGPGFDPEALVNDLLTLALHARDSENGSLILADDDTGELVFAEVIGSNRESLLDHRMAPGTGIVGQVVATRQAMLVSDVRASAHWSSEVDQAIGFDTLALMCAPLIIAEKVYGALEVVNLVSGEGFDDNDLAILRVTASFVSQALQEAEYKTLQTGRIS